VSWRTPGGPIARPPVAVDRVTLGNVRPASGVEAGRRARLREGAGTPTGRLHTTVPLGNRLKPIAAIGTVLTLIFLQPQMRARRLLIVCATVVESTDIASKELRSPIASVATNEAVPA
jgi:hypothetical protein